jgi:hypothetical protein
MEALSCLPGVGPASLTVPALRIVLLACLFTIPLYRHWVGAWAGILHGWSLSSYWGGRMEFLPTACHSTSMGVEVFSFLVLMILYICGGPHSDAVYILFSC